MSRDVKKILVLAGRGGSTWMLVRELRRNFQCVEVVIENREAIWPVIRRRVRKFGIARTIGQIAFALYGKYAAARARPAIAAYVRDCGLDDSPVGEDEFTKVDSVNDEKVRDIIANLRPSAIVVSGTRIIRARILESTDAKFINAHYGITPMYRGVHGAYWSRAQMDSKNCGVTIHLVDKGVDTGPIARQAAISPGGSDDFFTYPTLQAIVATPLVIQAVRDCIEGRLVTRAGAGQSRQWYHPTLWGYFWTGLWRGVW